MLLAETIEITGWQPWVGVVVGFFILSRIDNQTLKPLIGLIVLVMLVVRLRSIIRDGGKESTVPPFFAPVMGFFAGVTTMLANAAGPVMILYFLAMKFDKKKFIGTGAWYFFIINWIKVPFMAHLDMITLPSLKMDVMVFPAVVLGALTGIWLLKRIPQRLFNIIALVLAAAAAVRLLM